MPDPVRPSSGRGPGITNGIAETVKPREVLQSAIEIELGLLTFSEMHSARNLHSINDGTCLHSGKMLQHPASNVSTGRQKLALRTSNTRDDSSNGANFLAALRTPQRFGNFPKIASGFVDARAVSDEIFGGGLLHLPLLHRLSGVELIRVPNHLVPETKLTGWHKMLKVQLWRDLGEPGVKKTTQSKPTKKTPKRCLPSQMPHPCNGKIHNLIIGKHLSGHMLWNNEQIGRLPNLAVNTLLVKMRGDIPLRHRNGSHLANKCIN